MIKLNYYVEDRITGFKGFVVAITTYLYSKTKIGILSEMMKDNTPMDIVWIEEERLEVVKKNDEKLGFEPDPPDPDIR